MQEMNGYIKLYRKLIRWGWYQDNAVKSLFLHCLLSASFKDFNWMGRELKSGQFITSRKYLAEDLGFTEMQVRTALKKLESTKEITIETTNRFTIITVNNWEFYQSGEDESNQDFNQQITNKQPADVVNKLLTALKETKKSTSKSTSKKDVINALNSAINEIEKLKATSSLTNKQPTNNQQITNKQPHRKNVKECKEGKEYNIARARETAYPGYPRLGDDLD